MNIHELEGTANNCTLCKLYKNRVKSVFAKGNIDSNIMIIGMAPAKQETLTGVPFVGKAGKFLDVLLEESGLFYQDIYVTNILKCYLKPGKNIKKIQAEKCSYILKEQIFIMKPKLIIALGRDTVVSLFNIFNIYSGLKLLDIQGQEFSTGNFKIIPTYHPQYLARFGGKHTKYYRRTLKVFKKGLTLK